MQKLFLPIIPLVIFTAANAEQRCYTLNTHTAPESRFIVNNDSENTVTDRATGLTWMRCSLGQSGSDCDGDAAQTYAWGAALNEVAERYTGRGWRLPNLKELESITELACREPAINLNIFPNTQNGLYGSSTPTFDGHGTTGGAGAVDFIDGSLSSSYNKRSLQFYVRLVRNTD